MFSNETKVGALFLLFVGLMLWLSITMRGCPFSKKTELKIHFDTLEGLKRGDDVVFAGVPIGKVSDVRLVVDGVDAICALEEGQIFDAANQLVIPSDIDAFVEDTTVLGGKRIVILPRPRPPGIKPVTLDLHKVLHGTARGPIARNVAIVAERLAKLVGEDGPVARVADRLAETAESLAEVTKGIREGKGTLGKLVVDDRLYNHLDKAAENVATATQAIVDGRGVLGRLINDPDLADAVGRAAAALGDQRGSIGKLLHSSELHDEVLAAAKRLREVGDHLVDGKGTIGRLLTDDRLFEAWTRTGENLAAVSENLKAGKGTMGRLFTDEALYDNLRDISESLKKVTGKIGAGEGTLGRLVQEEKLYENIEKFVDTGNEVLGSFKKFRTYVSVGAKYHTRQDLSVYRFTLRVEPSPDKFFTAGGALLGFSKDGDIAYAGQFDGDTGDDGKFVPEAQVGFRFFDRALSLRLGYLEGQFGGGLDLDFTLPGLSDFPIRLTCEGRMAYADADFDDEDVNEDVSPFMLRVEGSVMILDHLRIFVGANNLCDRVGFTAGVSFEYRDEDIRSMIGFLALGR